MATDLARRVNSLLERRYRAARLHAQFERDHRHILYQAGLKAARRDALARELAEIDARLKELHEEGEG